MKQVIAASFMILECLSDPFPVLILIVLGTVSLAGIAIYKWAYSASKSV